MTAVLAGVMTNCISANTIARPERQDGLDNHPQDRGDFPGYRLGDVLSPRIHAILDLPMCDDILKLKRTGCSYNT